LLLFEGLAAKLCQGGPGILSPTCLKLTVAGCSAAEPPLCLDLLVYSPVAVRQHTWY